GAAGLFGPAAAADRLHRQVYGCAPIRLVAAALRRHRPGLGTFADLPTKFDEWLHCDIPRQFAGDRGGAFATCLDERLVAEETFNARGDSSRIALRDGNAERVVGHPVGEDIALRAQQRDAGTKEVHVPRTKREATLDILVSKTNRGVCFGQVIVDALVGHPTLKEED